MSISGSGVLDTPFCAVNQIVLAEDNPADVALVRMALEAAGIFCELRVIGDGQKAVAFLESLDVDPHAIPLDLLLLDIHLPRRDGEEVLRFLRATGCCAQTPVILLTGSDAPRGLDERYTGTHYFRKPSTLAGYMELGAIARDILAPRAMKAEERI